LVNNLIILPIKVNGIELNFLVDTGTKETILFSLDENNTIPLLNVETITLKGLGMQGAVKGLKSFKNTLSVKCLDFLNQEIIIILDQNFNFSSALGIEVNGIIGYHFFSHIVAKMDYVKKNIFIYNTDKYNKDKLINKFQVFDFSLENERPYIMTQVELNGRIIDAKCLIDTGNSDGLWIFASKENDISAPGSNFADYLGRGFSGDIFGKKAKVSNLLLGKFSFDSVITAFPDSLSVVNIKMVKDRLGTIGGEVLKRFYVIFDYQNNHLYVKKNKFYTDKFRYNTSGITIHHVGMQWYKEEIIPEKKLAVSQVIQYKNGNSAELTYNFKLLPVYEIVKIRNNSPAAKAGLQIGDEIIKINGSAVYRKSLDKINQLLRAGNQEEIRIVVARHGKEFTYKFKIVDVL
jgi:hypothetical protein